jgi:large subunit ribosomal protein L15
MPVNFRRKIRKMHGSKSCGYGMKKKHRGGGSRGGRGKAGFTKHKKTHMILYEPDHGAKKGFHSLKKKCKIINVSVLERIAKDGKVNFKGKIVGCGQIKIALEVKAFSFSATAKEKIEAAGGKIIGGKQVKASEV